MQGGFKIEYNYNINLDSNIKNEQNYEDENLELYGNDSFNFTPEEYINNIDSPINDIKNIKLFPYVQ